MVDLVKIRKKAKEKKKEGEPHAEPAPKADPAAPVEEIQREPDPAADTAPAAEPVAEPPEITTGTSTSSGKLERFKRTAGQRIVAQAAQIQTDVEERKELELLTFKLARENYAVEIENIVEIVSPRPATRVPNADPTIVGVISLRGTIVTVLDLRRKLKHPLAEVTPDTRMIVVEHQGDTAGFLVDRVSRVKKLDPSALESHPVVSAAEQSEYVRGVFHLEGQLVILLDLEKILRG